MYTLLVDPRVTPGVNKPTVYAGTLAGVYKGVNNGGTWVWTLLDGDLPRVKVTDLKMTGNTLVVGTYGRGVWKIPVAAPDRIPLVGPMEGSPDSFTASSNTALDDQVVATFTDPNNASSDSGVYESSIDWGDGTTSDGTVVANDDGSFSVLGNWTYVNAGAYPVSVKIVDQIGQVVFVDSTANVSGNITATAADLETGRLGVFTNVVVASFTDVYAQAAPQDYTAAIDWGDGTISSGVIQANGSGGFDVVGSHQYTQIGDEAVQVTIQSTRGDSASVFSDAIVSEAPFTGPPMSIAVSGTENTPLYGTPLATFSSTDPNASPGDFSASIQWGDGQTGDGSVTQNADGSFTVSGAHSYAAGNGSFAVVTTDAEIADAPLTAQGLDASVGTGDNTSSVPLASFTDADPAPSLGNFSAVIDWGDEAIDGGFAQSQGSIVEEPDGSFAVEGTHAYAAAGTYTATVYINDNAGNYAQSASTVTVYYVNQPPMGTDNGSPFPRTPPTRLHRPISGIPTQTIGRRPRSRPSRSPRCQAWGPSRTTASAWRPGNTSASRTSTAAC